MRRSLYHQPTQCFRAFKLIRISSKKMPNFLMDISHTSVESVKDTHTHSPIRPAQFKKVFYSLLPQPTAGEMGTRRSYLHTFAQTVTRQTNNRVVKCGECFSTWHFSQICSTFHLPHSHAQPLHNRSVAAMAAAASTCSFCGMWVIFRNFSLSPLSIPRWVSARTHTHTLVSPSAFVY